MDNKIEAMNADIEQEANFGVSNRHIHFSVPVAGYVYMQVRGPQDQLYVTAVSDIMMKDIHYNYFSFEIVHKDEENVFEGFKAGDLKV